MCAATVTSGSMSPLSKIEYDLDCLVDTLKSMGSIEIESHIIYTKEGNQTVGIFKSETEGPEIKTYEAALGAVSKKEQKTSAPRGEIRGKLKKFQKDQAGSKLRRVKEGIFSKKEDNVKELRSAIEFDNPVDAVRDVDEQLANILHELDEERGRLSKEQLERCQEKLKLIEGYLPQAQRGIEILKGSKQVAPEVNRERVTSVFDKMREDLAKLVPATGRLVTREIDKRNAIEALRSNGEGSQANTPGDYIKQSGRARSDAGVAWLEEDRPIVEKNAEHVARIKTFEERMELFEEANGKQTFGQNEQESRGSETESLAGEVFNAAFSTDDSGGGLSQDTSDLFLEPTDGLQIDDSEFDAGSPAAALDERMGRTPLVDFIFGEDSSSVLLLPLSRPLTDEEKHIQGEIARLRRLMEERLKSFGTFYTFSKEAMAKIKNSEERFSIIQKHINELEALEPSKKVNMLIEKNKRFAKSLRSEIQKARTSSRTAIPLQAAKRQFEGFLTDELEFMVAAFYLANGKSQGKLHGKNSETVKRCMHHFEYPANVEKKKVFAKYWREWVEVFLLDKSMIDVVVVILSDRHEGRTAGPQDIPVPYIHRRGPR